MNRYYNKAIRWIQKKMTSLISSSPKQHISAATFGLGECKERLHAIQADILAAKERLSQLKATCDQLIKERPDQFEQKLIRAAYECLEVIDTIQAKCTEAITTVVQPDGGGGVVEAIGHVRQHLINERTQYVQLAAVLKSAIDNMTPPAQQKE